MNLQLYDNIFKWIFEGFEKLSDFTSVNYHRINSNLIYQNKQLLYALPYAKLKFLSVNYEVVFLAQETGKISVQSSSFFLKLGPEVNSSNVQLMQKMNYIFDEFNSDVAIEVEVDNINVNFYALSEWGTQQKYIATGLIQYYSL